MAQQTFNNGDSYASVRSVLNSNATDAESRFADKKIGFMDYNNSGSSISLTANTWTDVPNDGAGSFTNKTYKPASVSEVMDSSTGYLDFTDLTLGSQIIIRSDFTVNPQTNNSLLEARYQLGTGAGTYELPFLSERLDVGSGIRIIKGLGFSISIWEILIR